MSRYGVLDVFSYSILFEMLVNNVVRLMVKVLNTMLECHAIQHVEVKKKEDLIYSEFLNTVSVEEYSLCIA